MDKQLVKCWVREILLVEQADKEFKLESGKLYNWQDFEEALSIPLAGSQGVGPGENRLATILMGKVQGQSQSFDLQVGSDQWEVKAPDSQGTIRPGTEGLKAYAPLNNVLTSALKELQEFVNDPRTKNIIPEDAYEKLVTFVELNADKIERGEITQNRFNEIITAFELAGKIIKDLGGDAISKIEIGGKKYEVTPTIMVRISKLLGLSEEDIEEEMGEAAESSLALSVLSNPVFLNPEELEEMWNDSVKPDEVFDLTGIILVNKTGFMAVRAPYGDNIKFTRVTQSKPRFKVPMSGEGKMVEAVEDLRVFIRENLLLEELTKSDKKEIDRLAKKQALAVLDREGWDKKEIEKLAKKQAEDAIKKALGVSFLGTKGNINQFVSDITQDTAEKWLKDKAAQQQVADITKKVMKRLYKALAVQSPQIIDRIKV